MTDNETRLPTALDLAVDALLAAPLAGGLVLVTGAIASGKSTVARALTEQLAKRSSMPSIALSDAMYVPNHLFAENKINAVVLWDEIRDGATFLAFLASSTHRFTIAVVHEQHWLGAVRKLLSHAGQLEKEERVAAVSALKARLVAVVETSRQHDITLTTPVPWPR
ncbi:hypothetical protein [Massilia sp. LjRoot122]|uniref:hypothetical protein n=1 Tax=Massilia sp. LjRoot122 TaxID=3342257 RepID=UPI003ED147BC